MIFSPSAFFIKNKTGEMLMFMAGKKPAFTELQQNEILPLDFARPESRCEHETEAFEIDGSSKEIFEGVPSSDLQPNSDTPGSLPSNYESS